ncbi:MAG: DUF58 domain-containing protein [Gemmataceae bacterium]
MATENRQTQDEGRRFLDPKAIARVTRLDLRARHIVEGFISGMHRSPFFGHSVEFIQHRDYTAGDDIRHLDWKVWSKTDKFYVKQFEEETNLRCSLIIDVSESMHYGRGPLNKYEYGCTVAACLAYLMLRQMDSVGCITFDEDVRVVVPPRSQNTHLDAICRAMDVSRPKEKTDVYRILRRVTEEAPSRGLIVIVSDLLVDRDQLFRGLEMLVHRKHDILLFHVMDIDELTFPFRGHTRFVGMEEVEEIDCEPKSLREAYLQHLEEYLVEVRRGCARKGIDYLLVPTNQYIDAVLSKFLHHRLAMLKGKTKT